MWSSGSHNSRQNRFRSSVQGTKAGLQKIHISAQKERHAMHRSFNPSSGLLRNKFLIPFSISPVSQRCPTLIRTAAKSYRPPHSPRPHPTPLHPTHLLLVLSVEREVGSRRHLPRVDHPLYRLGLGLLLHHLVVVEHLPGVVVGGGGRGGRDTIE